MSTKFSVRIPTNQEWDNLMDITNEDNSVTHWKEMFSWVDDITTDGQSLKRIYRGCDSARYYAYCYTSASCRYNSVGFRPAFVPVDSDELFSDIREGDIMVVGTLYMDGCPVKVPKNPTCSGDMTRFIPGSTLELKEALDDPAYQVQAIRVGNVLIADRSLLNYISYYDIGESLTASEAEFSVEKESEDNKYLPIGEARIQVNRKKLKTCGWSFETVDDVYLYVSSLIEWLESHNKNYTKEQYSRIQSLKEICCESIDYGN